jgi:hypothetical protein
MSSILLPRPNHVKSADLRQQFLAAGFAPGRPVDLSPEAEAVDRHLVSRMRCPCCCKRKLTYEPFTNSQGRYRILAECNRCGGQEAI